jgi:hypothetical protein
MMQQKKYIFITHTARKPLPSNKTNQPLRGVPEKVSRYKMTLDESNNIPFMAPMP